jgi:hypothetical protein
MSRLVRPGPSKRRSASVGETSPSAIRSVTADATRKLVEPVALPEPEEMAGLTLALAAALAEGAVEEDEPLAKHPAASTRVDEDRAPRGRRRAPASHMGEPVRGHGTHRPGHVPAHMTRDKAVTGYVAALRALRRAQRSQVISESAAAAARARADDAATTVATAQQALLMARQTLDATLMARR